MMRFIREGASKLAAAGVDVDKEACCVDIFRSPSFGLSVTSKYTSCLTASRAKAGGFYITSVGRTLDVKEMAMLQGFRRDQWDHKALKQKCETHREST